MTFDGYRFFALMFLLLPVGCGDSGSGSIGTFHDYQAAQQTILCNTRFNCCTPAQAIARDPMKPDAASCAATLNSKIDTTFAKLEMAISRGLVRYDSSAAGRCVDAIRAAVSNYDATATNISVTTSSDCTSVVVGTLPLNAACDGSLPACAPGLYCSAVLQGMGTCKTPAQTGEDCTMTPCAQGLACLPGHLCGDPLDEGQTCTTPFQCKSGFCDSTMKCVAQTVRQFYCS